MSLRDHQRELERINLVIRQGLEQAELQIPRLNDLIHRIAAVGLIGDLVLIGGTVLCRPYTCPTAQDGSGQVLLATLMVPGGLGVTVWDTEDLCLAQQQLGGMESEAPHHFQPFDKLTPAEKGLLMPHVEPLMTKLAQSFGRIGDNRGNISS